MQVAMQTMSWGRRPNVASMLREIKAAGYEGVELGQIPSVFQPITEFRQLLRESGLTLIGVANGSLKEKMGLVDEFVSFDQSNRALDAVIGPSSVPIKPYIYIDDWDPLSTTALAQGYRLALHPHMFKPFQSERDFRPYLENPLYAALAFLPDTAHLTVACENVVEVIARFYDRIEAIHLKDWTAEWGRDYLSYSRGFTELGMGEVRLCDVVRFLQSKGYKRWLVVEQEFSDDPVASAVQSRSWLAEQCIA
jgi:sugar phosphate isomerase/epimerase